jgi:hypothetical protein
MLTSEETQELIAERKKEMYERFGREAYMLMSEILMLQDNISANTHSRLIPVPEWNIYHTYPSVSAIRNLIARAETNGFNSVIVRKGKRIFIDEAKFEKWLKGGS